MRRVFILLLLLACSRPASAAWVSGTIASIEKYGDGQLLVVVVWTDDKGALDKTSMVVQSLTATAQIQNELTRRNATDTAIGTDLKVGTVVRPPDAVITPMPTPEDVASSAFIVLVRTWLVEVAKNQAKIGSQGAVDAAVASLAVPYAAASTTLKARYDATLLAASRGGLF